jgi:hypothetical protein
MANKALLSSAVLGILMGACGGSQPEPASPTGASTDASRREKMSCGNHEAGKCGSMDTGPAPSAASEAPLSITRKETIAPGKAVEVNLSFRKAAKAKATFNASGAVAWNVHSHPAGGMVEHQKGSSDGGEIAFEPATSGVYSFMWKNDGSAPVTLDITVSSDASVTELKH